MEIFLTIISGVCVFILSQYILEFVLKPYKEYRNVIVKIDNKLKFYSNVIVNPPFSEQLPQDYIVAKDEMRGLSCDLESSYKNLFFIFKNKEKEKIISDVAKDLIWLSNAIGRNDRELDLPLEAATKIDEIRKKLRIDSLD